MLKVINLRFVHFAIVVFSASSAWAVEASADSKTEVLVKSADKAYYIVSDCKPEHNIGECVKEVASEDATAEDMKQESEYVDFLMYIDDKVGLPFRAFMPYPESRLEIMVKNKVIRFEGIMILCVDRTVDGKIKARLFQAGRHKVEIAVSKEGGSIVVKSGNKIGLKHTQVGVTEGSVAVTVPWLCESCEAKKTFMVQVGDCFNFKYRAEPIQLEAPTKKPISFTPPQEADAIR